jgi:soluble lytic murein transglycosylase-like protein
MMHSPAALMLSLLALASGSAMAGSTSIYVTTLEDGLPSYSHDSQDLNSILHMTVSEPPPRPKQRLSSPLLRITAALPLANAVAGDKSLESLVTAASRAYGVPKALLLAVMHAESSFNPAAISPVGAVGLMQIMPPTGARYGVHRQLHDPQNNIDVGARYLKDLLEMFRGDTELALAAYNAGEGAVIKHGSRIPPYKETRAYVPKVMGLYERYNKRLPW